MRLKGQIEDRGAVRLRGGAVRLKGQIEEVL